MTKPLRISLGALVLATACFPDSPPAEGGSGAGSAGASGAAGKAQAGRAGSSGTGPSAGNGGTAGGAAGGGASSGAAGAGGPSSGAGGLAGVGGASAGAGGASAGAGVGGAGLGGAGTSGASAGAGAAGTAGAAGGPVCTVGQTSTCAAVYGFKGNCGKPTVACVGGAWTPCKFEPATKDACTPGDDATCNGITNEGCPCVDGEEGVCGERLGSLGTCAAGRTVCKNEVWGPCETKPKSSDGCVAGNDDTCDGKANEGCACIDGQTGTCGDKLQAKGACAAGTTVCVNGSWGACSVAPAAADGCAPRDDATCDGLVGTGCYGNSCAANPTECRVGVSCCAQRDIPASSFQRGNPPIPSSPQPPLQDVEIDAYSLDTFEITVGRFRAFWNAYPGSKPEVGAGAHPKIAGSGWRSEWDQYLPADKAAFSAKLSGGSLQGTWSEMPTAKDNQPMRNVSWYQLFAFCAWEGGRLPTEAEFENAAIGGSQRRQYPWGGQAPNASLLVYNLDYDKIFVPLVGSKPAGDGLFGNADLAGSVWEWVLDGPAGYDASTKCINCVSAAASDARVQRGGDLTGKTNVFQGSWRSSQPAIANIDPGGRCARSK